MTTVHPDPEAYDHLRRLARDLLGAPVRDAEEREFYRRMQNKIHYAATGLCAAGLLERRSDPSSPNFGLRPGVRPTAQSVGVARNYLTPAELDLSHVLAEQFLLHLWQRSSRGEALTPDEALRKLDMLLLIQDLPVFGSWEPFRREEVLPEVRRRFAEWRGTFGVAADGAGRKGGLPLAA